MTEMDGYSPPDPSAYAFTSDLPGMYHLRACGFSFADGHSELHKWLDGRTTPPLVPGGDPTAIEYTPSPGNVDVACSRITAHVPNDLTGGASVQYSNRLSCPCVRRLANWRASC